MAKTRKKGDQMQKLAPYLTLSGNTREVLEFYKSIFGGNIEIMTWSEAPDEVCGGAEKKAAIKDNVMHGCLTNESFMLMAADSVQDPSQAVNSTHLSFNCTSVDEIDSLFKKLSDGGTITMPLDNTFWGARFGMLTDKYGVPWMLNCQL